jgi:hypothetical protein
MEPTQTANSANPKDLTRSQRTGLRLKQHSEDRGVSRIAFSVPEWCARVGISKNSYYRADPSDRPATVMICGQPRITLEAEKAWLKARRTAAE